MQKEPTMDDGYEAPMIRILGSVAEITQNAGFSGATDGTYPPGTPSFNPLFS